MQNSGLTSPRGLPESNGRAVISALKTLQNKIREMEVAKISQASTPSPRSRITLVRNEATNTPRSYDEENHNPQMKRIISSRRSHSIGTDSDASISHRARSRSDVVTTDILNGVSSEGTNLNLVRTESSKRSKELEHELSIADQRCKLLEDRLNQMRDSFARAENERNRQMEAKLRSERERVQRECENSIKNEIPKLKLPIPRGFSVDLESDEDFHSVRSAGDQVVEPELINGKQDDSDLELDEVNLKFKCSPRNQDNRNEKNVNIKLIRTNSENQKKQKIPFCAARSTQPSHNVGLNIQGLLHQLKTKKQQRQQSSKSSSSDVPIRSLESDSSKPSRQTLNDDIQHLKELLAQLQTEFGDITLSCRRTDLEVDDLQKRLEQLEKKGQQVIVVKKLLKKKEEALRTKSTSTISSRNKSNPSKSSSSVVPTGLKSKHNRVLLREVKKIKHQLQ